MSGAAVDAGTQGGGTPEGAGTQSLAADTQLERFLKLAVAQAGDPYDSAHGEPGANNPNPATLDCSELVQWAAHMSGVDVTDGSWLQHFQLEDQRASMSVEEALHTPGALLFSFDPPPMRGGGRPAHAHVAISLGDGRTIEAMSTSQGIKIANSNPSRWTDAGMIPEFKGQQVDMADVLSWTGRDDDVASQLLDVPIDPNADEGQTATQPDDTNTQDTTGGSNSQDTTGGPNSKDTTDTTGGSDTPAEPDPLAEAAANAGGVDTDHDMLPDHFELKYGLDPHDADTDGDGITDGYELIVLGTDPDNADSDFDGLSDSTEISLGLDPNVADNPDPDAGWGAPDDMLLDTDGDGITDWGERLAGTDAHDADSDDDGVLDGDELAAGTDPLTANS
jgi:cell wall-associated NlpC family hydrolase